MSFKGLLAPDGRRLQTESGLPIHEDSPDKHSVGPQSDFILMPHRTELECLAVERWRRLSVE